MKKSNSLVTLLVASALAIPGCAGAINVVRSATKFSTLRKRVGENDSYRSGPIVPLSISDQEIWVDLYDNNSIKSVEVISASGNKYYEANNPKEDLTRISNKNYILRLKNFKDKNYKIILKDKNNNLSTQEFNVENGRIKEDYFFVGSTRN